MKQSNDDYSRQCGDDHDRYEQTHDHSFIDQAKNGRRPLAVDRADASRGTIPASSSDLSQVPKMGSEFVMSLGFHLANGYGYAVQPVFKPSNLLVRVGIA